GAGASVGKLFGPERAMRGGLGSAAFRFADGATVAALAVVNAVGDVVDPADGSLVAGARDDGGRPVDVRRWAPGQGDSPFEAGAEPADGNTTLGVVATDARLDKAQAMKLAQMAQDGLARTLYPAHTPFDGDTVFALATGGRSGTVDPVRVAWLGAAAATVLAEAVLRGARLATGLPGLPAVADLPP
ncbi:MAG: P1 family peptidase, partial [Holophagales bacterium]|nr:P1 family peptidase [Holophagales bacterium]